MAEPTYIADYHILREQLRRQDLEARKLEHGGGNGGDGGNVMEQRVQALEEKVGDIRVDVASIKATVEQMSINNATKGDVEKIRSSLIQWVVGTIIAAAAALGFARFITPPSGQPNITVNVPPAVSAPAPITPATK